MKYTLELLDNTASKKWPWRVRITHHTHGPEASLIIQEMDQWLLMNYGEYQPSNEGWLFTKADIAMHFFLTWTHAR